MEAIEVDLVCLVFSMFTVLSEIVLLNVLEC